MKKLKKYIVRNRSVVTGKNNLEDLYCLRNFPVFFGCVDSRPKDDLLADMNWAIDPETGVVQLTKLIPLKILYQSQHVDGCGSTWQKYYNNFAKYVLRFRPKSVLEIGGGQGQLAETVTRKSKKLQWIIVEPNPTHLGNVNIKIIPKFFEQGFKINKKVDLVVFSQLLEHLYDPKSFLENISRFLKPGGKLVFAYPNLTLWLKRKYTNALNFEHTMFLTDYFVDVLLAQCGFRIADKQKYKDHSVFYTTVKTKKKNMTVVYKNKYPTYKRIFMDFISYHKSVVESLNNKIKKVKSPVYCFGAHIFTSYLINFGLDISKLTTILDNSPAKQGRRFYGTNFIVESPKVLRGKGKVYVILKAGIYNKEIREDILKNINSKVVFW